MKICFFSLVFFIGSMGLCWEEEPVFRGEWVATAGPTRSFRGKWIGQALPGDPNSLHGSWTLTGGAGRAILSGTWSARKTEQGWRGTWSAQDQHGRALSGTWRADESNGLRSLKQLLERTLKTEVSGSWRTRGREGHWWLKGFSPPRNQ